MTKSDPLIRTKLQIPIQRSRVVPRFRLEEQLAQGLQGPLTLVAAPAGFGKTTLVVSSITGCGMPVAWLSLDKNDNQAGRFLSYLVAALQKADRKIGHEAGQILAAPTPARPDAVLTSLINDMESAATEIVLVLDDYQFITNPRVHEAILFILEYCPQTLHLVIATRSDPPLPLARMRARGELVELRASDLSFNNSETAQFLNEVMELRLDASSVAVLGKRTEGWIAGLQLAGISIRQRGDVHGFLEDFSGTHRYIMDYLLEEVLAGQTADIQHFLLYTSILERLTAPLCDSLLARVRLFASRDESVDTSESLFDVQSAGVLDDLERSNLFLLPLDDEQLWFRYHHLFADLLRARLQRVNPGLVPHLHMWAAQWLEREGFLGEAIRHLFRAERIDQAADLVERYGPARLADSDPSIFQMAEALPQEMIAARPRIGLYLAWLFIIQGRIGEALPLLDNLAQTLDAPGHPPEHQWMQVFTGLAQAFLAPPPGETLELPPLPDYQLLEEVPAAEIILRNAADFLYGMTLGRRGDFDRAVEVALRSIQRETRSIRASAHGTPTIPTLAPFLSRIYLIQGRLRATASLCHEFLNPIQKKGIRFIYTAGSMKIDLGEVLYEWNRLEEAEEQIRAGLEDNEPWGNILTDGFGLVALTRVMQAKGDHAKAIHIAEKFETRMQAHAQPREFAEAVRTLKVRAQLASGDLQRPSQWAERVLASEEFQLHPELYRLTLAHIRLAQDRYADVEYILAGTMPPAAAGSPISRQLESNLLLAAAVARRQRLEAAFELVEACLAISQPEGYLRAFLDVGEPVRDLLAALLRAAATDNEQYAQYILDAFSTSGKPGSSAALPVGLVEPLSEREMEVLQVMALGRTNREIARQLIVAPGTIKAHAASIYRKLEVANRTEAVARARQLGILP